MNLPDFKIRISDELREKVNEAIGEASMCWAEMPRGQYNSEAALRIAKRLIADIENMATIEARISYHIEALRPLLDAWSQKSKVGGE